MSPHLAAPLCGKCGGPLVPGRPGARIASDPPQFNHPDAARLWCCACGNEVESAPHLVLQAWWSAGAWAQKQHDGNES